jgi:isopropylmalate/homocitrate/citramalate synthase
MAPEARGGIWVSELNQRARLERSTPVRFYDTTLRDGEQTVGVVLDAQQKLAIARQLDELGVGRIEAGFPLVSSEDAEAIALILKAGLKAEIWGFARARQQDVDELLRLQVPACVIEAPTSDIKLKAYALSRGEVRKRATEAVRYARQKGMTVAFFAVDSTRTDLGFLRTVYQSVLEAGANELVVVDTIGACGPEAVEYLVGQVREWMGKDVPLHFHGHNDFGLATAAAVAAVRAGADWIHGTVNGMGERAGNADIGEIALALRCLYAAPVELRLEKLRAVSAFVQKAASYEVEAWKPAVGENLFTRESGAVASQFHLPEAIEPFAAELVGAQRRVVLGKKSGLESIRLKCQELGLEVPAERHAALLAEVKRRAAETRRLVSDAEFAEMVRSAVSSQQVR